MDNISEKLEILRHKLAGMIYAAMKPCAEGECCESCKYFHSTACTDYLIADYLLANGVTVSEVQRSRKPRISASPKVLSGPANWRVSG